MPSLIVRPQVALVDDPCTIRLQGADPGAQVAVRVTASDHRGRGWSGEVTLVADSDGTASTDDLPALVASMTPDDRGGAFSLDGTTTLPFAVTALPPGAAVGQPVELHRVLRDVGVSFTPIRQDGVVGSLFLPPGPGPHPGVVVLGGLEGGLPEAEAALLASRGLAALALALWGADALPPAPARVPVDPIERAFDLLAGHLAVARDRVAAIGWSIGGTAALLAAATWPERVSAVVACAASPVVFSPPASLAGEGGAAPWSYRTVPVPFVPLGSDDRSQALIPLERIAARVLLVSGGADGVWPASDLAELAASGLATAERLDYRGAGHGIRLPHMPTAAFGPVELGGSPEADARAAADAWPRMVAFLGGRSA